MAIFENCDPDKQTVQKLYAPGLLLREHKKHDPVQPRQPMV